MDSPVKLYLHEHVHPAVADGLRRRGADVLTTQQAGMLGASDEEHLQGLTLIYQLLSPREMADRVEVLWL